MLPFLTRKCSQGEFKFVIRHWDRAKQLGQANRQLYTVVMAMCERIKSAELAVAVKDDLERQNWTMETR